jgi:hypothetical protein
MKYESSSKDDDCRINEILATVREEMIKTQRPANEIILDDVDLRNLLKISERTTAALRAKNMITYSKPGKVFYLLSDVLKMLNNYKIESLIEKISQ